MRASAIYQGLVGGGAVAVVVCASWSGCAKRLNDGPSPIEDIGGREPLVFAVPRPFVQDDGVAATVKPSRNDGPTIASRCKGWLGGCLPDGADEPLGDVFTYRYRAGAARIVTDNPAGEPVAECRFDGECESWGCGEQDNCVSSRDVERCPAHTLVARGPKKRDGYCGCVERQCRRFEQRRPELILEFDDIEGSVVQRGWGMPSAYERRLLVRSLDAAVAHSGTKPKSRFDPMESVVDEMPTVRQCFKALRVGAHETLYLDVTVNDRSEASAALVRGGSPSLRKCVRERLLTSIADWRPVSGLTGLRATMHASVVTVPEASR